MLLPETLAAAARRERVAAAHLILFDFEDEPFYAWTGTGILRAAGFEWKGLGRLATISALPLGTNDTAGQATFGLSGVDADTIRLAKSEAGKVDGREVTVWLQFLSAPHRPLDDRIFLGSWVMAAPRFTFSGPRSRGISVSARSVFDDRKKTSFATYSDGDLQARFPGDLFLEFASQINAGYVVRWPKIP